MHKDRVLNLPLLPSHTLIVGSTFRHANKALRHVHHRVVERGAEQGPLDALLVVAGQHLRHVRLFKQPRLGVQQLVGESWQ